MSTCKTSFLTLSKKRPDVQLLRILDKWGSVSKTPLNFGSNIFSLSQVYNESSSTSEWTFALNILLRKMVHFSLKFTFKPFRYFRFRKLLDEIFFHVKGVALLDHLLDCLQLRFCYFLLHELINFCLPCCSDYQTVQKERHCQEPGKVSTRQNILSDPEKDLSYVQWWRRDVWSNDEVSYFLLH